MLEKWSAESSSGRRVTVNVAWPAPWSSILTTHYTCSVLSESNYCYYYCHSDYRTYWFGVTITEPSLSFAFFGWIKEGGGRGGGGSKGGRVRTKTKQTSNQWSFKTLSAGLSKMMLTFFRCSEPRRKSLDPATNSNAAKNERKSMTHVQRYTQ